MNRHVLLAGLIVLLTVVLVPLFGDIIQAVVVYPLLYTIAVVRELGGVVPQWLFLTGFIAASLILAIRSLLSVGTEYDTARSSAVTLPGPVARWARRINAADRRGDYAGWVLARHLGDLADEVRQVTRRDRLNQPTATRHPETAAALDRVEAIQRTQSFRQFRAQVPDTLPRADLDRIIRFLERELELDRDSAE